MHDFRINTNRRRQFADPHYNALLEPHRNSLAEQGAKIMRKGSVRNQLEPIAETQGAHIVHLMKKYQGALPQQRKTTSQASTLTELSQVDNGILFLDNYEKIVNPTNMKTPPPPIWGETLEEDDYDTNAKFYDHQIAMQTMKDRRAKDLAKLERNGGGKTQSQRAKILKLKRKVVYTYEYSDDDSDHHNADNEKNIAIKDEGGEEVNKLHETTNR